MGVFEKKRALTSSERGLAMTVFRATLPYANISVGHTTGLGGAPWTEHYAGHYTLHVGAEAYADCTSPAWAPRVGHIRQTFIHELTHVWQGSHCWATGWYQVQSVLSQAGAMIRTGDRNDAYKYTPGADWDSYNVEQQACIVEDWYADGCKETSPLFPYVRDIIRK